MAGNRNSGPQNGASHIATLARAHTTKALKVLEGLMHGSSSDAVRAQCAQILLDRGWGKAAQELVTKNEGTIEVVIRTIAGGQAKDTTRDASTPAAKQPVKQNRNKPPK